MRFVWDPRKAKVNTLRHGVTFEEAVTVFADPLALIVDDTVHPERALIIGESMMNRIILTVFCQFEENVIRVISARLATSHERRHYENDE
jgi:uncharacterized DUF497 family protein